MSLLCSKAFGECLCPSFGLEFRIIISEYLCGFISESAQETHLFKPRSWIRYSTSTLLCKPLSSAGSLLHSSLNPNKASGDSTPSVGSLLLPPHSSMLSPSSPLQSHDHLFGIHQLFCLCHQLSFSLYWFRTMCYIYFITLSPLALCFAHSVCSVITECMTTSILLLDWVTFKSLGISFTTNHTLIQ